MSRRPDWELGEKSDVLLALLDLLLNSTYTATFTMRRCKIENLQQSKNEREIAEQTKT